jgi:hypothetical protein
MGPDRMTIALPRALVPLSRAESGAVFAGSR